MDKRNVDKHWDKKSDIYKCVVQNIYVDRIQD